eukprot:scaffold3548_cov201-Ochromonas_danica.AAC.1
MEEKDEDDYKVEFKDAKLYQQDNTITTTASQQQSQSKESKDGGGGGMTAADESPFKLLPRVTISDNTSEVFCVRFSPDGKFVAAGCGDGAIRVFNSQTGALAYNLQGGSNVALPTTALRFRPVTATTRTKNVILASNAAGIVQHWHMTSGKCLHSMEEENKNQVYALDYDAEGARFVTAGKDTAVRLYNEATKSLIVTMQGGTGYGVKTTPGHSNRIFAAKFLPRLAYLTPPPPPTPTPHPYIMS